MSQLQPEILEKTEFGFNGSWLPNRDPLLIGAENFQKCENSRPIKNGLEGVRGYGKINTTALSTYLNIKNGHHFKKDAPSETHVLVHALDGSNNGKVWENTTAIPDQGDFVATQLLTEDTDGGLGRFSEAVAGHVTFANEKEVCIWGGTEMSCAAFLASTAAIGDTLTNVKDFSEEARNKLTSAEELVIIGGASNYNEWIVGSTRPLKGIKYYISSANVTAATTMTGYYWSGSAWVDAAITDGTASGGITLAQTGWVTFTSTVSTAKIKFFEDRLLYFYRFSISNGDASISHVTLDAPFQPSVDIWDGIYRQCIQFQFYNATNYEDYTVAVNAPSDVDFPIGGVLDGLVFGTDYFIGMFDERMTAVKVTTLAGLVNTNASVISVSYWNGTAWTGCTNEVDETSNGGKSIGQSGTISWESPAPEDEFKYTLGGVTGYAYKFTFSATLSGAKGGAEEVLIDLFYGIPAQNKVHPCKFPSIFKNRTMHCGFLENNEGNRVDYTANYAPDVHNGIDSAMGGLQSLYFGGAEDITGAAQLYNRFGSNVFTTWVVLKDTKIFLLVGDGPVDWRIFPISKTTGSPAPLSIATAEMSFAIEAEGTSRNILLAVSHAGPIIFDGAILKPLEGIENYFNPDNTECINFDYIELVNGWFDTEYKEYNILIPSGSSQTTNNVWLVYSFIENKWFSKNPGGAQFPQCGFSVTDTNGIQEIYSGATDGYIRRLEYGTSWDGTGIAQEIHTGDFFPSKSFWDMCTIRFFKMFSKKIDENAYLTVYPTIDTIDNASNYVYFYDDNVIFTDGDVTFEDPAWFVEKLSTSAGKRVYRRTKKTKLYGWSFSFKFIITLSGTIKGFQPLGWGFLYRVERREKFNV